MISGILAFWHSATTNFETINMKLLAPCMENKAIKTDLTFLVKRFSKQGALLQTILFLEPEPNSENLVFLHF